MYCSSDEEDVLLLLAALEDSKIKRKWVQGINRDRQTNGEFITVMPQLRKNEKQFYVYFHMSSDCFDEILNLIKRDIRKENTNYRESISPEERLAVYLRFLATGDSYTAIGQRYCIGYSTISEIVKEVSDSICNRMQNIYMPEPSKQDWLHSARDYYNLWQFPNCIGSIDCKYITIKYKNNRGPNHWCNTQNNSIVLVTIVGPDYKFICVDIGLYGKDSNSGIFASSNIGKRFEHGSMNVPEDKNLPEQNKLCAHVLIGDTSFTLKSYLMRPFPKNQSKTDSRKEKYNMNLCRARCVVENAFSILAQKWKIFYKPLEVSVETTIKVVKTACILHNFLITKECDSLNFDSLQPPEHTLDGFSQLKNVPKRKSPKIAFEMRDKFLDFFNK